MPRPLEGIRILDLTIWQQGTYATAILADLGADVIKVEERAIGDPGRGAWVNRDLNLSSYFQAHNRGKRSVAIDLKHPEGREVFLRLVSGADAFVNNLRQGAIRRLRLEYDDLAAVNPGIVYVHASGFGPAGEDADAGAFDFLAQARGGFASTNGEPDDPPIPSAVPIADQVGALHACIAVLAGLASRVNTGRGAKFDTSLLGSVVALQSFDITNYLFTGRLRDRAYRGGNRPFWRIYQAGDGKWFIIGMLLDRAWDEFCALIERSDLLDDARFDTYRRRVWDNASDLCAILDEVFAAAPAAHWIDGLNRIGMFAAPVQDYAELAGDRQVVANRYIHEVPAPDGRSVRLVSSGFAVDGEPVTVQRLAPQLGEHSEQVLLEAGYSWDEIGRLRDAGVIGPAGGG
jgi:crotonobetainyl-CoA:carnitine CoA-transferase CaiB-like acyl-CoA transferase